MAFDRAAWLSRRPPNPDDVAAFRGTPAWRRAIAALAAWLREAPMEEWPEWPGARYAREAAEREARSAAVRELMDYANNRMPAPGPGWYQPAPNPDWDKRPK